MTRPKSHLPCIVCNRAGASSRELEQDGQRATAIVCDECAGDAFRVKRAIEKVLGTVIE